MIIESGDDVLFENLFMHKQKVDKTPGKKHMKHPLEMKDPVN